MLYLVGFKDNNTKAFVTDLYSIVVDAICQWITPHSDVQVGVTQPLNSLLNVRHSPQGNLLKKVKSFIINDTLHFVGKMLNH